MDVFAQSPAQLEAAGAQWTTREVLQQPTLWSRIEAQVASERARLDSFLAPLLAQENLRVILTGAGTSAFIGECLAPALARHSLHPVQAVATTDLVAGPDSLLSPAVPTLLVSFARSGNSPESLAALELVDGYVEHCAHLVITCNAEGALYQRARTADNAFVLLLPEESNDRSFAMTSSFSGMLFAAALVLGALRGTDYGTRLAQMAEAVLPRCRPLLSQLIDGAFERVVFLGSKELKGLAHEAALKMLELTDGRVMALAESALGFRHGPKTILNSRTLVVAFVSNEPYTRQYDWDVIQELRRDAVAARVIALSGSAGPKPHADDVSLNAPAAADLALCLPFVLFAQSLALARSLSLGLTPDRPNVAGTVNRVVQGVTIYPWRGGA